MLEFAAAAPRATASIVLREHRAALELVRLSLRERDSPYAHLLDAVCRRSASPRRRPRPRDKLAAIGPPQELVGLEPFAPPEVMPPRSPTMSAGKVLLWIILPYVAMTVFVVGHWWRYRTDQFAWTSRSTQLLDRRVLGWASPLFHYGALAAIGGHVIGLCHPASVTARVGISESIYRWFAAIAGGIAGAVTLVGFLGLLYRRARSPRVTAHHHSHGLSSPTCCSLC